MSDDESLGSLFRAAITEHPAIGHLDPAAARTAAGKRRQRRRSTTAGVLVVAVLAAVFAIVPGLHNRGNIIACRKHHRPTPNQSRS